MDLSIIVVSWNTQDLLDQCLRSVFELTTGIGFEVIVVDNASSDGSPDMVRDKYPQVRLISNQTNVGFAAANNQAMQLSLGRHVMLLNPDTIVLTDLSPVVIYLDANLDVGIVGCKCLNVDGSIQRNWYDYFPSLRWEIIPERLREAVLSKAFRRQVDSVFPTKWVGGQCLTVRRECIDKVGLLDPAYFIYSEETDLCYRIRASGWAVVHYPGATIVHLGGQSTKQASSKMLVELYRSKTVFIRKHRSVLAARIFKGGLMLRTIAAYCVSRFLSRRTGCDELRSERFLYLMQRIREF